MPAVPVMPIATRAIENVVPIVARPYRVVYWEVGDKSQKRVTYPCFAELGGYRWNPVLLPPIVRYVAPIHPILTREMVEFYIAFLRGVFGESVFRYRMARGTAKRVVWELKTDGMTRTCAHVHLTAFRYVDEFAAIIKTFYGSKDKPLADQWTDFLFIHRRFLTDGKPAIHNWGHALIYRAKGDISIDQFRVKLADPKLDGVNACFNAPPEKA